MQSEIVIFFALLLGGLVHSTAGFGSALVAMPILTFVISPVTATPLQSVVGLVLSAFIFHQHRGTWPWRDAVPLILFSLLGVPVGTYALVRLPETVVFAVLGATMIGYVAFELIRWRVLIGAHRRHWNDPTLVGGALAGFIAGVLGGAYASNGPPAIIYGSLRGWPKGEFKSVLQSLFVVNGLFLIAWQGGSGLLTREVAWYSLFAFPGLIVGAVIGARLDRHIKQALFRRMVLFLLALLGVTMIVRAVA